MALFLENVSGYASYLLEPNFLELKNIDFFFIKISKYKIRMEDKSGHLRKRLDLMFFTRKLMKIKTIEAENSGSLYCTPNNSFNTTQNSMKLILNENILVEIFIHVKYVNFSLKTREIQIFKAVITRCISVWAVCTKSLIT